ncbi:helix-turn-helix domain-containing protein [Janthinobacterium lividum]
MRHLAVTQIGLGLGFNSASDFSRAFSRAYGMSPRDYREQFGMIFPQNNILKK